MTRQLANGGPWTVRVWQGTIVEPDRALLAEGRARTLTKATQYARTTYDAANPADGEYVWAEAVSLDERTICTFDTDGDLSPWVPAPR